MKANKSATSLINTLLIRIFISFFIIHLPLASAAKMAFPECDCPEVGCNTECEVQVDLSFYSEKCGKDGGRVRSCAKPKCVPQSPLPKKCENMAAYKKKVREPASVSSNESKEITYTQSAQNKVVASVVSVEGKAWLHRLGSKKSILKKDVKLKEQDLISTDKDAKLQFEFMDGNIVNLTENTEMKIASYLADKKEDKRQTVLDLIKGRVRNKVKQKYQGAENYYRVRTKSAVAGVRGTDFVITFYEDNKEETKVETIHGAVILSGHSNKTEAKVEASQYASYVVDSPGKGVFDKSDMDKFVARGYLTPVFKMNTDQIEKLDWDTELAMNRRKAPREKQEVSLSPTDVNICSAPSAQLNQCSWVCKNNPKGAKSCRTDLADVKCVRQRCNANGKWSNETRLPASFGQSCDARKTIVKDCDY